MTGPSPSPALIDTHCHLNDPSFDDRLGEVLERAQKANVSRFVVPAYDVESLARTAHLAAEHAGVIHAAFGIHPWYVAADIDYRRIVPYIREGSAVAVGEIGLDYSPECPPAHLQLEAFTRQLDVAVDSGLPVIVHCRKAHDVLYRTLRPYAGKIRGVMHSFSGGRDPMFQFLELGFYISFSGSVTRRTAKKYHRNVEAVPAERLLIETDAPSIATETTVASAVEPSQAVEVARKVAELRNMSFEDVCAQSTINARRLFALG